MKKTKLLLLGALLSTSLVMAGEAKTDDGFSKMKTKCTTVVSTALDCMNKATKPMEMKICKSKMKRDFLDLKINMMESGKMGHMGKGMGKGKMKGKCGAGKCGGAK